MINELTNRIQLIYNNNKNNCIKTDSKLIWEVTSSPILISSVTIQDAVSSCRNALDNENVNILVIDARQIIDFPELNNNKIISNYLLSSIDKELNIKYINDVSISNIITTTPSLLFIDNIDIYLSNFNTNETNEQLKQYLNNIQLYVTDIYKELHNKYVNDITSILTIFIRIQSIDKLIRFPQFKSMFIDETKINEESISSIEKQLTNNLSIYELNQINIKDICNQLFLISNGSNVIINNLINQIKQSITITSTISINEVIDKLLTRYKISSSYNYTSKNSFIAPVHWEDIGGLDSVREKILDIIELPKRFPHLFKSNYPRRRGILLFGPPGTGKTLVAKAVATECNMSFISVKGPELLDMYVGESERNVREIFEQARNSSPCILFFDELDSIAPARSKGSDSAGGVIDRVVSQLLTEMDSLGNSNNNVNDKEVDVIVMGATNRPDLLDSSLLRPGRFDRKIFLSSCKTIESRLQILKAQTRNFNLSQDVDLMTIAASLPDTVTGADIGALTASAYSNSLNNTINNYISTALTNQLSTLSNDISSMVVLSYDDMMTVTSYINEVNIDDISINISQKDFNIVIQSFVPSLTSHDINKYEELGRQFDDESSKNA